MLNYGLSGVWNLHSLDSVQKIEANVPGNVHLDLLAAGLIPDPFWGENENKVRWVAEKDWEYQRNFIVDEALMDQEHIDLVCDGLDTLATVTINGETLLSTNNMFCQYRQDVKKSLRIGENEIKVVFSSALNYVQEKMKENPLPCVGDWVQGWAYLRKAASHFGWDWGPILPTSGIWKDIRLEGWSSARIIDVFIRQLHYSGKVTLGFMMDMAIDDKKDLEARLVMAEPDGKISETRQEFRHGRSEVIPYFLDQPQLWWPNGYGEQPLYQATLSIWDGEVLLDEKKYTLGIRKLELKLEDDPWGTSFKFLVNDVQINAKGSNWIPADSLPTRISRKRLKTLIESAAAVNQNMIRVWGGGYYEDDEFYDLCDRYGILVWQDFMFTCAVYPLDQEDFLENIRNEVSQAIHRLRHHACLALWCGNNEMEVGWTEWGWDKPGMESLKTAFKRFFYQILLAWVIDDDPDRPYWPGSPSSGAALISPQDDQKGDIHEWRVWHEQKPITEYHDRIPRFVSEFGFQSFPSIKTISAFADQADGYLNSIPMESHQKNGGGNGRMMTYLCQNFRMPKDFKAMVYLTQIQQGEALKTGIEHWRRNGERTSGTLYWQLNDCWPAVSWSTVDYFGRWKAAHYMAKHFFAPLMVSVKNNGLRYEVFITNDHACLSIGFLQWTLMTLDGEVLANNEKVFIMMPAATEIQDVLDFSELVNSENYRKTVLVIKCMQNEELIQMQVIPFTPNKHLLLKNPKIKTDMVQVGRDVVITLTSTSLARYVELSFEDTDIIFSSNYFDLPARNPYRVTFSLPDGWDMDRVKKGLKIHSLVDSY